jgi:hypothetical protein
MTNDEIDRILAPLLLRPLRPAERIKIAETFESLAAQQRALADAQQRELTRPPDKRLAPKRGAGGRPSAPWVEVLRRPRRGDADLLVVRLSTSLYYAAGSPARLDVQRVAGELLLRAARGDAGYKVMVNRGGIRIAASGSRDVIGLEDGKYAAEIRAGAIVVGAAL